MSNTDLLAELLDDYKSSRDKIMAEIKKRYPIGATAYFYLRDNQKNESIGHIIGHNFSQSYGPGDVVGYVAIRMKTGTLYFIHHSQIRGTS